MTAPLRLPVSGFSDEIAADLATQLDVISALGMSHLCLRAADGRGVAEYDLGELEHDVAPRLAAQGVRVSALGSPIGKIRIGDHAAYEAQLGQLETLCRAAPALGAGTIRMFSFYMPRGDDPDAHAQTVLDKVGAFAEVAGRYGVVLVLENEKHLFGDIGRRCEWLIRTVASDHLAAAFDFANFVQCDDDPWECWRLLQRYVRDIHVKDARRGDGTNVLCGTGDGQIAAILADAISGGFRGFLTLEPHLASFATFAVLETQGAASTASGLPDAPGEGVFADGTAAFRAQHGALAAILEQIGAAPC
jgi:sugar phosphate isomerase/epimerase